MIAPAPGSVRALETPRSPAVLPRPLQDASTRLDRRHRGRRPGEIAVSSCSRFDNMRAVVYYRTMNRNCEICEGTFDPTGLDCEHVQEPVDGDIWDEVAR